MNDFCHEEVCSEAEEYGYGDGKQHEWLQYASPVFGGCLAHETLSLSSLMPVPKEVQRT